MFSTTKREATNWCVLTAALGVFLAVSGGAFAANHSPQIMNVQVPVAANPGMDSSCQVVLDANDKLFTTPYHLYMTMDSAGVENGKSTNSELIFAGGVQYVMVEGKWQASPMSTAEMKAMSDQNRKNATNVSCHFVRLEPVKGEISAVYSMHNETPRGKSDGQIWISKGKGLLLRQEIDLISNNKGAKTHLSTRIEYGNVQAPKL